MSYSEIVLLITKVLVSLLGLLTIHFMLFAVVFIYSTAD